MIALLNIPRIQVEAYETDCEEKWNGKGSGVVFFDDGRHYYIPFAKWNACVHCPDDGNQTISGTWECPIFNSDGTPTGDTVFGSFGGRKIDPDGQDGGTDNVTGQWSVDSTTSDPIYHILDHQGEFSGEWDDLTTNYTQGEVKSGEWHTIPPVTPPASGSYDTGTPNDNYYGYLYRDCRD